MNRAILTELTDELMDKLVALGAQRADLEGPMLYLRNVAIASEAEARSDAQFLLDLSRFGSDRLGEHMGKSGQAIRKRYTRIMQKKQPPVAVMVAE